MAEIHTAILVSGAIAHVSLSCCNGLQGHLNRTEPLLMLLVTAVLFITTGSAFGMEYFI